MKSGVGLWIRASWRRRWGSLLAMALVAGLSFAIVATAFAGARRTLSSIHRARRAIAAYDHGIVIDAPSAGIRYDDAVVTRIRRLSEVQTSGEATMYVAALPGADWQFSLNAPSDDALGTDIERERLVRGRLPDPNSTDQVTVNETTVARANVDVGSTLVVDTLTPEQMLRMTTGDAHALDHGMLGPRLTLHVVGVVRNVQDVVGRPDPTILANLAFDRTYRDRVGYSARLLLVHRAPAVSADELHASVDKAIPGPHLGVFDADVEDRPAIHTVHTLGVALEVFALVAGLVSVIALNQLIIRQVMSSDADDATLGAIGLTRAQRVRGAMTAVAPAVAGAAVIAVVVSTVASVWMPVGVARLIEPDPGIRFDSIAAAGALIGTVVMLFAEALAAALSLTRNRLSHSARARAAGPSRPGIGAVVELAGLRPAPAVGVRLAFARRPPPLPVRSTLVGICSGAAIVVGALTFLSSLDRLDRHPARWGYGWDLALDTTADQAAQLMSSLQSDHDLAGEGLLETNFTLLEQSGASGGIRAWGLDTGARGLRYAVLSGLQPVGPNEVVIGPAIARSARASVGDVIDVARCPCTNDPARVSMAPVRVVGIALFPEDDNGNFNAAIGFSASGFAAHVGDADTTQVAVRFAPHADRARVVDDLTRRFPRQMSASSFPVRPGEVVSVIALRRFPLVLAAVAGLLMVAVLGNLSMSTQQRRRRTLATLRSIGFTPADTIRVSIWQSVAATAVAAVVGSAVGVVAGASVWVSATHGSGVGHDASRPVAAIAACVGVLMTVAVVLGAIAALRTARSSVAAALHDE